jgi:hypothetical protein
MDHPGRSPLTLIVASVSSAAAAVVVRQLWAPGTVASAALTPLLIAVFGELLHRPAYRLTHAARERLKSRPASSWRTIDQIVRIPSRWQRVLVTTGAAFLIGSVALTGWELLAHHSLASARDRTTLWGGAVPRGAGRPTVQAPGMQTAPAVHAPAPRQRRRADSTKPAHDTATPSTTTTSRSGRPATTTTAAPTTTAPAVTTTTAPAVTTTTAPAVTTTTAPAVTTTTAPAVTTTTPTVITTTTPTSQPPPQP